MIYLGFEKCLVIDLMSLISRVIEIQSGNNKKCSYKLMPYLILFLSYIGIILSKDECSWINFAEFSIWRTEEMASVKQSMIKRLVFGTSLLAKVGRYM